MKQYTPPPPNINYSRVLPRDLFNEAKLLKCMGLLCLMIHDQMTLVEMVANFLDDDEGGFEVGLIETGELTITNLTILVKGKPYLFKTTYNSKLNYPLYVSHNDCDYLVFDEEGKWDEEFQDFLSAIK